MAIYGYLNRTSINERDDRDIVSMFQTVPGERVVIEQAWSLGEDIRPAFDNMLNKLVSGDILYIGSIDRLGLDAEDSIRLWHLITREKGADIIVLDNKRLNSRENRKLTEKQLSSSIDTAFSSLAAKLRRKGCN